MQSASHRHVASRRAAPRDVRQRMSARYQRAQPLVEHMGVDLRGRDVGMAEHRLHAAQIGVVRQQVAGEGVAQHVRRDALRIEPAPEASCFSGAARWRAISWPSRARDGNSQGDGLRAGRE